MSSCTVFNTGHGIPEMFCSLSGGAADSFKTECEALYRTFTEQLDGFAPVWIKIHLSDIANQYEFARQIFAPSGVEVVMIGQPPADGARIALEAWCLPDSVMHREGHWLLENYELDFFSSPVQPSGSSEVQMHRIFEHADERIRSCGGTLENNLHRTWIYCRDVDNNYAGLVKARREYFEKCNLTAETHYITSTGIEGQGYPCNQLVRMDSLAIYRLAQKQVVYLKALENLSPTNIYGVTFERATRIIYGDRSHYYISGTASIDHAGEILHAGDVAKQTVRMMENVEALLKEGEAALSDLKQVTVYLRDSADAEIVNRVLDDYLVPSTGRLVVRGAVCRPGWLVELEGIAVNGCGCSDYKDFI